MKHLKHTYKTLVVTPDLLLKYSDKSTCNIHAETAKTLGTHV
jgi:hypothetical protein